MKKLLCVALLLMLTGLAFGQATAVPTCNSFNLAGAPIYSTAVPPDTNGTTNCTDYFGSGNWANSPLPAGTITGYTLIAGGSGYSAPTVTVTDMTGAVLSGAAAPTPILTGGVITGFTGGTGGTGYTAPVMTITDTTGSGAMATAIIGPPFTGGMKKFLDPLTDLKTVIATADTTTFANSDYYEIALVQYTQSLSPSNLPATTLRGYVQVPTGSTGCTAALAAVPKYLGPVILAQKGRPARVKFTNCLPTGSGGNLFIPVDSTYMGAGMGPGSAAYTQNRATLHLHGGATPWISDGTPHQWTVPVGETSTLQTGDSVAYVPDMWFDANGAVIASCAGQATCGVAGATNNPGAGSLTFFWTNDQGARLMFYHDHAYGLTRLNVYAGEAAGYVLFDPAEENALAAGTAPGTLGTTPDLTHFIPLVIQDKTFVPSAAQIAAQDPTWVGNFGATALNTTTSKGNGDLWFPHVYMPNQNPNDPVSGANGFGRWDYGAWFFPPQTALTAANPPTAVTNACTSSALPGQTLASTPSCPSCGCPIIPNPSGTPEAFMDTPLVNGVAYPVLHVAPAAYRFKILSAGNDRSWNLSWFVADATQANTEVAMLPAAPPSTGSVVPLCTAINPVAVPSLVLGLVNGLLDNAGNPLNGTGLPAGCWPNYGPQPGIPAPQTMWAADGRAGGTPDPRNAGPAWIQIGSEGGLLPAPVVIPPTPINYEQNTRSITIGSVAMHGLWLGPAERADVIVDFSQFAGKNLILYNDAPTPAPAFDSRLDYFTGDGDQTPIGGAPNTPAGYGPNTRTIMQVVVDGNNPNSPAFSLAALKAAFASTATAQGVFAATQPTTIVPEPAYNSAYNKSFTPNYASIQSTSLTFTPIATQTLNNPCTATAPAICDSMDQKAIQELFTVDYGRMNATLGTELPNVNFQNQTTIPLGYVDPATEIIKQGETQLWKITHNGVDTHFIHFHLFNVQVINRVGWDGSVRPIDANEAGWKDTVRMNPLEDILVALQPITPSTPFPIGNSIRLLDVTSQVAAQGNPPFSNLDPYSNAGVTTLNALQNFGWEYVWHCHILGHEENDMMRPIIFQVPPAAPSNLTANLTSTGTVNLQWTDNSASETGFIVQRDYYPAFPNPVTLNPVGPSSPTNGALEGYTWGGTISATDPNPGTSPTLTYYYRVQAVDNGWAGSLSQSYNAGILGSLVSAWSTPATANLLAPAVTFTGAPASAVYNTQFTVTATTNSGATPTITSSGVCTVGPVGGTASSATAMVTMAGGTGTCTLTANWPPAGLFGSATLTQTTAAVKATPTVTFNSAPSSAPYNSSFTVTGTTNAGVAPAITGTAGICTVGAVPAPGFPSATATVTMTRGTGTCALTASWPATANYSGAVATKSITATKVNSTTSITTLTPNPAVAGQPVTVAFSVAASGVTLSAGATGPAGTVTVTGNGSTCTGTLTAGTGSTPSTGSCQVSFPLSGNKTLTATYAGDANFNTSTSGSATETVRDFSMTISPTSQSVNGNQSAKYTVTVTSLSGFTGPVNLGCGGTYPSSFACSVSPASVTLGGSATAAVTVNTVKGKPGTYTLTLTGTSGSGAPATGGLTRTASATVTTKN